MAFGTGPQKIVAEIQSRWTASRTGRDDVPDLVRDSGGNASSDPTDADPSADERVLVFNDYDEVGLNRDLVDRIHCYHPEADPMTVTDNGYKEQRVTETVQVDIDLSDYTDHTVDPPKRVSAKERMVGSRGTVAALDEPPYPGIFGETKYVLEEIRRGVDEFDRISHDVLNFSLESSDAFVAISVECDRLAANTVV